MIRKIFNTIIGFSLPFVIVFVAFSYFLPTSDYPIILSLSFLAGLLSLFFFCNELTLNKKIVTLDSKLEKIFSSKFEIIYLLLYISFLLFILFDTQNQPLFLFWNQISQIQWFQFIIPSLLCFFFPGYAVLRIITKGKGIDFLNLIVFSFLLSLFVVPLSCFLSEIFKNSIKDSFILLNFLIIISLLIQKLLSKFLSGNYRHKDAGLTRTLTIKNILTILSLIALFSILSFSIMSVYSNPETTYLRGDGYRHFSWSLRYMQEGLNYSKILNYPYWWHLFFAVFLSISNLPLVNSYILFTFTNLILVLGFYKAGSAFFTDQRKRLVSTLIWSFFTGFGWLYTLKLHLFSHINILNFKLLQETGMATHAGIIYENKFIRGTFPSLISLFAIIMIIYLWRTKEIKNLTKYFLISASVFLSYTTHIIETIVFFIVFIPVLIIFEKTEKTGEKKILSCLIALLLIRIMGFLFPLPNVYFGYLYYISIILLSVYFLIARYLRESIKEKISFFFEKINPHRKKIALVLLTTLWFFYFLSFLVFIYKTQTVDMAEALRSSMIIPWYLWPIMLGTSGFVLMLGLTLLIKKQEFLQNKIKLLLGFIVGLLLFGKIIVLLNYYFFSTGFNTELRIKPILSIPLALFAGYIIVKLLKNTNRENRKKYIKDNFIKSWKLIFLSLIIFAGAFSTMLSIHFWKECPHPWALGEYPITNKRASVSFLYDNVPNSKSVAIYQSHRDYSFTRTAGKKLFPSYLHSDMNLWFDIKRPEIFYRIFHSYNIEYIYIDKAPLLEFGEKSYFKNRLTNILPLVYEDKKYLIYKWLPFHPPTNISDNNTLGFVTPQKYSNLNSYLSTEIMALSGFNYKIYKFDDSSRFSEKNLIITTDEFERENQNYIKGTEEGNNLIILLVNSKDNKILKKLLKLKENKVNRIKRIKKEKGAIILLNLQPIVKSVNMSGYNSHQISAIKGMFNSIKSDIQTDKAKQQYLSPPIINKGNISFSGKTSIKTNYIKIENLEAKTNINIPAPLEIMGNIEINLPNAKGVIKPDSPYCKIETDNKTISINVEKAKILDKNQNVFLKDKARLTISGVKNIELNIKNFNIDINGKLVLNNVYVPQDISLLLGVEVGKRKELKGKFSFHIPYADQNAILLNNFKVLDKIKVAKPKLGPDRLRMRKYVPMVSEIPWLPSVLKITLGMLAIALIKKRINSK